jgi:hypothetical protein
LSLRDEFHSNSRTNFLSRCGNYHRANSSDALRFSPCSRQVLGRNSEDQSWPRNQTPAAFTSWSAAWPAPSWAWPQLGSSSLTLLCSRWLRKLSRLRTPVFELSGDDWLRCLLIATNAHAFKTQTCCTHPYCAHRNDTHGVLGNGSTSTSHKFLLGYSKISAEH